MYQSNIDSLSKAMNSGNDVYMRLSSGQILLKPSDDPAGAASVPLCVAPTLSVTETCRFPSGGSANHVAFAAGASLS